VLRAPPNDALKGRRSGDTVLLNSPRTRTRGAMAANNQPLRALTDEEALAWLRGQAEVGDKPSRLAQQFGWTRQKAHRRLDTWSNKGLIVRRDSLILLAGAITDGADKSADASIEKGEGAKPADVKTSVEPTLSAVSGHLSAERPQSSKGKRTAPVIAVPLGGSAVVLAVVAVTVNARYAASFGQSREAAMMLAAIGVCIDVLATILPSAAGQLWHARHVVGAVTAWGAWCIVVSLTLLAAAGWSASNIGDAVTARTLSADRTIGLVERLHRLRSDRGAISEQRAVAAIEALIQVEQGKVDHDTWKATKGCSDVTISDSARACGSLLPEENKP
jgi:hypothetical protein